MKLTNNRENKMKLTEKKLKRLIKHEVRVAKSKALKEGFPVGFREAFEEIHAREKVISDAYYKLDTAEEVDDVYALVDEVMDILGRYVK